MNNNTDRKYANIEELKRRSKEGFLNKLINNVTPIQETIQKTETEQGYDELVSSILDE
jgi:hypothetical protein